MRRNGSSIDYESTRIPALFQTLRLRSQRNRKAEQSLNAHPTLTPCPQEMGWQLHTPALQPCPILGVRLPERGRVDSSFFFKRSFLRKNSIKKFTLTGDMWPVWVFTTGRQIGRLRVSGLDLHIFWWHILSVLLWLLPSGTASGATNCAFC